MIIFKRGVLINLNTQFSLLHFLGVFLVCLQSFMVLELWMRHTDRHWQIAMYKLWLYCLKEGLDTMNCWVICNYDELKGNCRIDKNQSRYAYLFLLNPIILLEKSGQWSQRNVQFSSFSSPIRQAYLNSPDIITHKAPSQTFALKNSAPGPQEQQGRFTDSRGYDMWGHVTVRVWTHSKGHGIHCVFFKILRPQPLFLYPPYPVITNCSWISLVLSFVVWVAGLGS